MNPFMTQWDLVWRGDLASGIGDDVPRADTPCGVGLAL